MHSDTHKSKKSSNRTLLTSKPKKKRKDEGHESQTKQTGYAAQY